MHTSSCITFDSTLLHFHGISLMLLLDTRMVADGAVIFIGSKWIRNRSEPNRTKPNQTEQNKHYVVRLANVVIIHSSWNAMCAPMMFSYFFLVVVALNVIHQLGAPVNVLCMCLSQHFYSSHSIILSNALLLSLCLGEYTRIYKCIFLLVRCKSIVVFFSQFGSKDDEKRTHKQAH